MIGTNAFYNCTALLTAGPLSHQEKGIEYNIQYKWTDSIAEGAFAGANYLKEAVLPVGITEIPANAFNGCASLEEIVIPETVNTIGEYAFSNCNAIIEMTVPKSVNSVGQYAFYNCDGLEKIAIHGNVSVIEDYTFRSCGSLAEVTLPKTLTEIGIGAFNDCVNLKRIDIPAGVNTIGESAFRMCESLEAAYFYGDVPSNVGWSSFSGTAENFSVYYPASNESGWTTPTISLGDYSYPAYPFTVEKCEHDYVEVVIAPTCEKDGCTRNICNFCGHSVIVEGSETAALGHDFSVFRESVKATCRNGAYDEYKCSRCSERNQTETEPALGHDYSIFLETAEPACDTDGYTKYKCSRCSGTTYTDYIDAHGHHFTSSEAFPATCTEDSYKLGWCVLCEKNVKVSDYRTALGHDYSEWNVLTAPTETADGSRIRTCSRCENTESARLHPLNGAHKYAVTVVKATCKEQGYVAYSCTGCEHSYKDHFTPVTVHDFGFERTEQATCAKEGKIYQLCTICEEEHIIEVLPKTEHELRAFTTPATCVRDGQSYTHCLFCDYEEEIIITPAYGHSYAVISTVEATCDKAGYDNLQCIRCLEETVGNIKLVPHVAGNWIVEELPTEKSDGMMYLDCAVCLNTVETRTVPRLTVPEDFDSVISDGLLKKLSEKTTLENLTGLLTTEIGTIKAYLPDGSEITDPEAVIGTGCQIKMMIGDVVTEVLTSIVEGDLDGDGLIGNDDLTILSKYYAGIEGYGEQILNFDAADIDGDGETTRSDAMFLARKLAGWYE